MGFFFVDLDGCHKCVVALLYSLKIACLVLILGLFGKTTWPPEPCQIFANSRM